MEEVEEFKYSEVFVDGSYEVMFCLRRWQKWQKSVTWMSQVNGEMEISRGRMVCELLARPSMEYAAELW